MSSPHSSPPAPRRSGREKKQVQIFSSDPNAAKKRKREDPRSGTDDDEDLLDEGLEEERDSSSSDHEDEEEPEFVASRKSTASSRRPKGAANALKAAAARGESDGKPPPPKKPRVAKLTPKAPKAPKGRRKGKGKAIDVDMKEITKDTAISDDNALFNAVLNPSAALQSTAEDFLESYQQSKGVALADLINCILRACGCNSSIDSDQVLDSDGVVDTLEDLTEELKKELNPTYPLASKLPIFRKFRRSLSELLYRLVISAAETGALYDSELIPTLQTWSIAMSSSQVRSVRHTATVVALEVESALAEVAAAVDKEAEVVRRQKEGDKKKKGAAGSANEKSKLERRERDLQEKFGEVQERRSQLKEYLEGFFDGSFVLRYRDADAGIRADCIQEFGVWLEKYPAFFLEGNRLRYLGWVLSDTNTQVRLAAARSLAGLYKRQDYLISTNHFTQRFKPRLVTMATSDIEVSVRVAVIQILCALDALGELEEDQSNTLCLLIFDQEVKVRKAASAFVHGVWNADVEERLGRRRNPGSSHDKQKDKGRVGLKSLASLLVKWAKTLEKDADGAPVPDQTESQEGASDAGAASGYKSKEVTALVSDAQRGRVALCIESLWDDIEVVSEWEEMLEHLLLDHSAEDVETSSPVKLKRKKAASLKNKKKTGGGGVEAGDESDGVDEAWRLTEPEEAVLVEVFVTSLKKTLMDAMTDKKKGEAENVQTEITRVLIKALPRLFTKHQADERRIAEVLLIPQLMNLDLYLEMRMVTAYETLWDDVTKQFLSHSSPVVLRNAVQTIKHLLDTNCLSNTNTTKIAELDDELASALRDVVNGRDELDVVDFSDDDCHALRAFALRVESLFRRRDMTAWMEEDEGGKQASIWTIMLALADRGRRGYADEELMIDHVLQVLTLHIAWKAGRLASEQLPPNEKTQDELKEKRDALLEKLEECAFGVASRPCQGVKRSAFRCLITLYTLFHTSQADQGDGTSIRNILPLELTEEMQFRYAGFIEAEFEQYAEDLMEDVSQQSDEEQTVTGRSEDEDEDGEDTKRKKAKKGRSKLKNLADAVDDVASQAQLEREYIFTSLLSLFLSAIRAGAIHFRHSVIPLTYYGRLGVALDQCLRVLVEELREEGMYKGNGHDVATVISDATRESFVQFLEGRAPDEDHTTALSKAFSAALVVRGAQLSIIQRLDGEHLVDIHKTLLTWIIKKLAQYDGNNNKKGRNHGILFFRILSNLTIGMTKSDASKIKDHLDESLEVAKIEPSATAKLWEPLRGYERRLTAAISKDKPAGSKGKKKSGAKAADFATTDEEGGFGGEDVNGREHSPPPRPRTLQRKTRASRKSGNVSDSGDDGPPASPPKGTRPRPRPRPKQKQKPKSAPEIGPTQDEDEIVEDEPAAVSDNDKLSPILSSPEPSNTWPMANGKKSSPRRPSPKKRPRDDEMDDDLDMEDDDPIEDDDDEAETSGLLKRKQHSRPPSQISQMSQLDIDFFKTRKRIRR